MGSPAAAANGGGHLGDLVAALVDGELDHDTRDRALAHVALCGPCQDEVRNHRRIKARLSGLDAPGIPGDLASRLASLPVSAAAVPAGRSPRALRPAVPGAARRRARLRRVAGGVLVGAGAAGSALVGTAFVVGGSQAGSTPAPVPAVAPQVDVYAVQHATTAGGLPLGDPAQGAVETVSVRRR